MKMKLKLNLPSGAVLADRKGFGPNGHVQAFHTANVNRRIGKYMPHLTGTLETKLKITKGTKIIVLGPYAKYQYYGKAMSGPAPKVLTDRDLEYTKTYNPMAGPYWDRALVAAEGKAMAADLQRYINRRSK